MMAKVSTLLFALVALSAANVLAAPSHIVGRQAESSAGPDGASSSAGASKPMGNSNHEHPRLWNDKYCHMPHNGGQHGGNEPQGSAHPTDTRIGIPMSSTAPIAPPSGAQTGGIVGNTPIPNSPSSTASGAPSAETGTPDADTSGSFDGNNFDIADGDTLDATHSSSSSTSSSSNDNDSLHIST